MKLIKNMLFAMVIAIASPAQADNYGYLTVAANGSDTNYELSGISKITFDETNMILWNGGTKTAEIPLASLDKMFFSGTSGISAVTGSATTMRLNDGILRVTAPTGSRITLYNIKGQLLKEVTASGEETEVNLRGLLTKGVYIVKVGNETRKLMNNK